MAKLTTAILCFFTYSFAGWVYEVILCSGRERRFINRGVLTGPYLPIYGTGALLVAVLLRPVADNPPALFFASIVLTGVLEYFTSYALEKMFSTRWWDYSARKFNLKGRVCLEASLVFGTFSLLLVYAVHPAVLRLWGRFSQRVLLWGALGFTAIFTVDFMFTLAQLLARNAQLKELQQGIERHLAEQRAQFEAMFAEQRAQLEAAVGEQRQQFESAMAQRRAAVAAQLVQLEATIGEQRAQLEAAIYERRAAIAEQLEQLEAAVGEQRAQLESDIAEGRAALAERRAQFAATLENLENSPYISSRVRKLLTAGRFTDRRLHEAFPHMASEHYSAALEELKKRYRAHRELRGYRAQRREKK